MKIKDRFILRYYFTYYFCVFCVFYLFIIAVNFKEITILNFQNLYFLLKNTLFDVIKISDTIICIVTIIFFIMTKKKMYFLNFALNGLNIFKLFKNLLLFIFIIGIFNNFIIKDTFYFLNSQFKNKNNEIKTLLYIKDNNHILSFFITKKDNQYFLDDVLILENQKNTNKINNFSNVIFAKTINIKNVKGSDSQFELEDVEIINNFEKKKINNYKIKLKISKNEIIQNYNILTKNINNIEYYLYEKLKIILSRKAEAKIIHDIKISIITEVQTLFSGILAFLIVLYFFFNFNRNINILKISIQSFLSFLVIRNINFIITNLFINLHFLELLLIALIIQLITLFTIIMLLYLKENKIELKNMMQKYSFLMIFFILFTNCQKRFFGSFIREEIIKSISNDMNKKNIIDKIGSPIFKSEDGKRFFYITQSCTKFLFLDCMDKKIQTLELTFDLKDNLVKKTLYEK